MATDANGCSESLSLVVNEPPLLLNTNTVNNVTCNGGIDGAIYPNVQEEPLLTTTFGVMVFLL